MGKKKSDYQYGKNREKNHNFIKCKWCRTRIDASQMEIDGYVERICNKKFVTCPECNEDVEY